MSPRINHRFPLFHLSLSAAMALVLGACAGGQPSPSAGAHASDLPLGSITLDGDTSEWPGDAPMVADDRYLYLRFAVENAQYTLQSAPVTTSIQLDLDGSTATGRTSNLQGFSALGVDLEIEFSPREGVVTSNGVAAYAVGADGGRTPVSLADLDFACTPTYASSWYEMRLSRSPQNAGQMPEAGLRSQGPVSGIIALYEGDGRVTGYSDPFTTEASAVASGAGLGAVDLPAKPANAVRVMAFNVQKSNPISQTERFQRLFQAVQPDIVLISEWEEGDAAAVQAWFTGLVDGQTQWNVRKAAGDNSNGGGVAIVSRYTLVPFKNDALSVPGKDSKAPRKPVRFVAGRVITPHGEFIVGATHFKCCGTKDSSEDRQRMEEARAVNQFMAAAGSAFPDSVRVVGGDLNLVGSRPPLDLLRARVDADGSDLAVAGPLVLGDRTMTTWRDAKAPFGPGRLDFIVFSDGNAEAANSFVLDTARLSDESLAKIGLDRSDSGASDHLPVVIDLRRTR
jgi:endonuclease/exonuclease/phosphatase family metal-dependent hydrolase